MTYDTVNTLHKELALFRAIVDHARAVVGAKDLEGRYLFVNEEYSRLFHIEHDTLIGRTDTEIFPAEIAAAFRATDRDAVARDEVIFVEEKVPVDEELREYLSVKFPIRDGNGKVFATGLVATDITERKQAEAKLEYLATRDSLTGLYNHKELKQRLIDEIYRASRYNHELSIFFLDIDHFKTVNDRYGHQAGDNLLCSLAQMVEGSIRKTDYAARYGGEEFVVILPETSLILAERLANRLREKIAESSIHITDGASIKITASIGVANYPAHAQSCDDLLGRADLAMYSAKKKGRNRVESATAEPR